MDTLISESAIDTSNMSIEEILSSSLNNPTTIPDNPQEINLNFQTSRFSSAEWYAEMIKQSITLIGLGGIGSYVSFLISRLSPHAILAYDNDHIEQVNISGQLYSRDMVGNKKATAASNIAKNFGGFDRYTSMPERFDIDSPLYSNIMICGLDNMSSRKMAFSKWVNTFRNEDALFIDGRLAAEEFQIFCMTGKDLYLHDLYNEKWLFDDNEAEETLCSYKQTSFCANMIGSFIVNLLVNYITNRCNPLLQRELPFMTSYDARTMTLKLK